MKSYHHGNLKAALKKAALKLVRQKGPRGFSLNEASRLAGVTAGAPYRHFADKDALLADIICDGNALLAAQVREAVQKVAGVREKMLEAGMAYLHFSVEHADYFLLMFSSGLEKSAHPEVQRSAQDAFSIILDLALQSEPKIEAGQVRAVSAWALVHGLAVLNAEGALDEVIGNNLAIEDLRPVLWDFVTRQSE
ncbi:MAG: TetR/AcrR family transcriptional regulator [Acidobacteriaceae bacterium]|nr:TetR/AcrR family transcriptional regulator [Acidobacteriaceae bacterium]